MSTIVFAFFVFLFVFCSPPPTLCYKFLDKSLLIPLAKDIHVQCLDGGYSTYPVYIL